MAKLAKSVADAKPAKKNQIEARQQVLDEAANEFVFAVVGHVGSGTSEVARSFKELLDRQSIETSIIKASSVIETWSKLEGQNTPDRSAQQRSLSDASKWQDLGDEMRKKDTSAVAKGLVGEIRSARAAACKTALIEGEPVLPDGAARAYILDALRHPAEVNLLRHLYQDAFVLIGVVCDQDIRENRLSEKFKNSKPDEIAAFMRRDEKDNARHGQQVAKTFQLADFYVDNTPDRFLYTETGEKSQENPDWDINDKLQRLVRIVRGDGVERPMIEETAMHQAYSAQLRSACLSRQVGAALIDESGNLLATGTNEVPKAGGGVYGETFSTGHAHSLDHRCAYRPNKICSSTDEQVRMINEIVEEIAAVKPLSDDEKKTLRKQLKDGRIGDTIEFSRAVHAEMDALISAGRSGASTIGTRLFVTTYPCHYCARHIISAGVDEVQYIEPYFKSLASKLHSDALQQRASGWTAPSHSGKTVLFHPFTGVAPRLYHRAFVKDRDLKNDYTGKLDIGQPDWGAQWHLRRKSYVQLEAQITRSA